jgi:prefoldin subunit 5
MGKKKQAHLQLERVGEQLDEARALTEELQRQLALIDELHRSVTARLDDVLVTATAAADTARGEVDRVAATTIADLEAPTRRVEAHVEQLVASLDARADDILHDLGSSRNAAEERISRAVETAIAHIDEQTAAYGRRADDTARDLDDLDVRARELVARAAARLDELQVDSTDGHRTDEPVAAATFDDEPSVDEPSIDEPSIDEPLDDDLFVAEPLAVPVDAVDPPDLMWPDPVASDRVEAPEAVSAPLEVDPSVHDAHDDRFAADESTTAVATMTAVLPDELVAAPSWPLERLGAAVEVAVVRPALTTSLEILARNADEGWVRAELTFDSLRLTVRDASGWWEHHDVPVQGGQLERTAATVDVAELLQAVQHEARHAYDGLVSMTFDGNVAVGTTLVLARPTPVTLPVGPRRKIARIELQGTDPRGLVLDTDAGRFVVPSRLVSLLRSRLASAADVVIVGDQACLVAPLADVAPSVQATILAPLPDPDHSDDADRAERRDTERNVIQDLVGALSSTTSADELRDILATGSPFARRRAIAHPSTPEELVEEALVEGDDAMRAAAASNPSMPQASLETAMRDSAPVVRAAVAGNPAATEDLMRSLAEDPAAEVRAQVARHVGPTTDLLPQLAADPDSSVRTAVAGRVGIPAGMLAELAADPDPAVCAAVAENPGCAVELLDALVGVAPEAVLSNPRTPEHLLQAGAQVKASQLRAAVAANPSTPARLLDTLSHDPSEAVLRAVAVHPSASSKARRRARKAVAAPTAG